MYAKFTIVTIGATKVKLKIEFREKYVDTNKTFLETPDKLSLPDIKLLHMKCSQAIDGKVSESDESEDSDDDTCSVPLMSRKKHKEFSQNQASYEQSWMANSETTNSLQTSSPQHQVSPSCLNIFYTPKYHSLWVSSFCVNFFCIIKNSGIFLKQCII